MRTSHVWPILSDFERCCRNANYKLIISLIYVFLSLGNGIFLDILLNAFLELHACVILQLVPFIN